MEKTQIHLVVDQMDLIWGIAYESGSLNVRRTSVPAICWHVVFSWAYWAIPSVPLWVVAFESIVSLKNYNQLKNTWGYGSNW